jgi:hypothetical protein
VPWSVLGGIFFTLLGLFSVWMGIYGVRVRKVQLPRSPAERWLWLIAWVMSGLGMVCLGVSVLRHAKGQSVSVPTSAPLIDHVIWVLVFVGMVGGFSVLLAWMGVSSSAQEKRARRENAGDS